MRHDFVITGPPDDDERVHLRTEFSIERGMQPVVNFIWDPGVSPELKARAAAALRETVPGVVVFHDGVEATR